MTVTGKTDFLNVADMSVTIRATLGRAGALAVTLRFSVIEGRPGPNAWYFSRSFPNLPNFFAGKADRKSFGKPAIMHDLLDTLILSDAAFVIATGEGETDPVTGAPCNRA